MLSRKQFQLVIRVLLVSSTVGLISSVFSLTSYPIDDPAWVITCLVINSIALFVVVKNSDRL